jgi:hypothetical protein
MYNPLHVGGVMKSKGSYRVSIRVGDAEIEVEGAETGVVKIVEALSDLFRAPKRSSSATELIPAAQAVQPITRSTPTDIRSFFAEKQPSSDVEAAAVAAYYYQYLAPEAQRSASIDSTLLQDAFRLARRPLPAKTIYTLQNARGAGYLDSTGETGQFRLNPVGYNLVEHSLGPADEQKKPSPGKSKRK